MAAPALVTLLFDALVEAEVKRPAMVARKMALNLEHKVVVVDPDELHIIEIAADGSWTMGHPAACKPNLFGCLFQTLAVAGFEAPHPGRFAIVIEDNTKIKVVPT